MDNEARKRIRIMYLIIRIIIICHWVACLFYKITHSNWHLVNEIAANGNEELMQDG